MNILAILVQAAEHGAAEGGGGLFSINTGVSLWTIIIFLTLLAILTKFAWRPILGALEARERRIQEILDAAARDREEAERLVEEQRRQANEARQLAQQILAEGKQAAEKARQEMLERARAEQEQLIERARAEIAQERERSLEAIRREAVDLSLAAAARLVQRRFTAEEDRKLVRELLEQAASDGPAREA